MNLCLCKEFLGTAAFLLFLPLLIALPPRPMSHVGCRVRSGEVLHADPHHLLRRGRLKEALACEDLPAGCAEILRQESVDDGVDARVPIG